MAEAHEAGDVEKGHDGEDLVAGPWCQELELLQLVALCDEVMVGDHDGFGETGCAGGEVQVAADFLVGLVLGDAPGGLRVGDLSAEGDEVLDVSKAGFVAF